MCRVAEKTAKKQVSVYLRLYSLRNPTTTAIYTQKDVVTCVCVVRIVFTQPTISIYVSVFTKVLSKGD